MFLNLCTILAQPALEPKLSGPEPLVLLALGSAFILTSWLVRRVSAKN